MNFFIVSSKSSEVNSDEYPLVKLTTDSWDDFSYKTLFRLYVFFQKKDFIEIGEVKIMHIENSNTKTVIPSTFIELSDNEYCSLGQSLDFYERLKKVLPDQYEDVLNAINDAATNPGIAEEFENTNHFKQSLLRWSEAEKAYRQARLVIENLPLNNKFKFNYSCQLEHADTDHKVDFDFSRKDGLPHRVIGIIGKNGTGKTQYLSRMAVALSGQARNTKNSGVFSPNRPPFTKVIAVSYSAFDRFTRPTKNRSFSYKYCGLKDEKGLLSQNKVVESYTQSINKIKELTRERQWYTVLKNIFSEDLLEYYYEELFTKGNFEVITQKGNYFLSSGQSILMFVLTETIANIKYESLILFDEPEMHLHPNAIANLIRMLHDLLEENNSYAIVATHSPIIIQEIPSHYVYVFERIGNIPIVRKLDIESFGETITTLTQNVFDTIEVKGTYKDFLEEMAEDRTFEEVLEIFNGRLSFNAATYLKGIYNKKNK